MIYSSFQENPDFKAGIHGFTPLMLAAGDADVHTVEALLNDGADVNARNKFAATALHWAADFAFDDIPSAIIVIKMLLGAGAEINVQKDNGVTPLMMASYRKTLEVVRLLLESGADPNLRRDDGSTARSFIEDAPSLRRGSKRILKLLEEFGGIR